MRRLRASGLAGGASGGRDPLQIEGDDEGIGVDSVETKVGGVGKALGSSVDLGAGDLQKGVFEAVAEGGGIVL